MLAKGLPHAKGAWSLLSSTGTRSCAIRGNPWHSALLHPSPPPRPRPVLWSCDLGEKCPLQVCSVPKMPRKGRVFLKFLFILFLAVLGLRCRVGFLWSQRAGATLGCSPQASPAECPLVAERGLRIISFSSCRSHAQLLHSVWSPPGPGIEPVSPASVGGFSTTGA